MTEYVILTALALCNSAVPLADGGDPYYDGDAKEDLLEAEVVPAESEKAANLAWARSCINFFEQRI